MSFRQEDAVWTVRTQEVAGCHEEESDLLSDLNKASLGGDSANQNGPEEEGRDAALTLKGGMAVPSLGFAGGLQIFLSEVRAEFKKITWPSRQQVVSETGVVLFVVFFLTVLITLFDWLFALIANRFLV